MNTHGDQHPTRKISAMAAGLTPPTFSIIIPARNVSEYIQETLNSVISQTCSDWECIVVDDASTDDTASKVLSFSEPRITFLSLKENYGVSRARNVGLETALGNYLVFLDGDDVLFPDALSRFLCAFECAPEISAVYGEALMIHHDGTPAGTGKRPAFHPRPSGFILPYLLKRNLIVTGSLCVSREFSLSVGRFDDSLAISEDWEYWCRLAVKGRFHYLGGHPVMGYRIRETSASRSGQFSPLEGLLAVDKIFSTPSIIERVGTNINSLRRAANASVYEYAANHSLRKHDWKEARTLLAKCLALSFCRPRAWILLGCCLIKYLPNWIKKRLK